MAQSRLEKIGTIFTRYVYVMYILKITLTGGDL